ncbi:hypothetical protein QBC37DRAFT_98761 [Rhypophila decipiens]|uniref:Uncharacterized protein n=1 Tax=Rhypophila decipiens TaxID=261697 RepID=A0AAN6XUU4_9PEZI|nr:hypothetical protein QBC37DRAFT_98761 [Rhypophila decipiens]
MKVTYSILFALQAISVIAAPAPKKAVAEEVASAVVTATGAVATATGAAGVAAPAAPTAPAAVTPPATGGGAAEEEKDENEIEQEAQFGAVVNVGANIKTDTLFPPGKVGRFEVEIQNNRPRLLRVSENKTPAPAPPGFTNLEGVSWRVEIGGGGSRGFQLAKIDYIANAGATTDISKGQIGRLCRETNSFVIGEGVGELEFEVEENELTVKVDNLVGEWAVFLPVAAGAGAGAAAPAAPASPAAAPLTQEAALEGLTGCEAGTLCRNVLDLLLADAKAAAK